MDYAQYTPILRKNKHLTLTERVKIELLTNEGKTPYAIAKIMERPINTILNELRRGSVDQIKQGKLVKIYYADAGQARYYKNRKNCGRKYSLMECSDFISYVETQMLDGDWSVDAAVGRAAAKSSIIKKLSTKTIYNYIDLWLLKVRNIDLPLKLKRDNKPKRVRQNRRVLGDSIDQRPKHIEDRQEFGHWEIDTVIGTKAKNDEVLLTLVERMTRNVIFRKIQGKTAEDVMSEVARLKVEFGNKFSHVFKTITADNDSEFAALSDLKDSEVGIYFTHPYSEQRKAQQPDKEIYTKGQTNLPL